VREEPPLPTYYAIRLVLLIAPHVPLALGYRLCELLGLVVWRFNGPARRAAESNLAHVLGEDAPASQRSRALRGVCINLVKDYYELVLLAVRPREEVLGRVVSRGLGHIDQAREAGKGVIAVFFHTSGFNLVMQAVLTGGWPSWVVAEPLEPPPMRRLVNGLRSALGVRLLAADRSGARNIIRALRRNELVVLAGDRGVSGTGAWVRFFGAPAFLPAGAAALALRTGAAILPVATCRLPDNRVLLEVGTPIGFARTGDFDADVAAITQTLAAEFEKVIRQHPQEWVVMRPVWESGPAGQVVPGGELPPTSARRPPGPGPTRR
jgi:KDO2-lipid IV(A) lauroyltransferase